VSHGVKIVSLAVQDVGALTGRIDLGPFVSGVNVISGRNEIGKSTLVEALRSALFERHDAKHQGIRALQTHGTRNAPEMWVELEIGGESVSVHKRFLEKPLVEVRLQGMAPLLGAQAEELLLARLEGRAGGKRGADRNDMGLWGLLWVTQDETAHADPGMALDDEVRGALSESVGRQVGRVLGGKHGERLRTRVIEHAAQFFTRKIDKKTGEYKAAEERKAEADKRVAALERAILDVEELATQHAACSERLREMDRRLPALEEERRLALEAEARVQELGTRAQQMASRLAAAEAALEATRNEEEARAALKREAEALAAEIARRDQILVEMEAALAESTTAAADTRDRAGVARKEVVDAREALESATARLARTRRRAEATRCVEDLRKADEVAGALADATRQRVEGALDDRVFDPLQRLATDATALRARFDAEGTRLVVHPRQGEASVTSVGTRTTVEVPGLGTVEVEPARPGLARAVADAREKRAGLDEALLTLGVGRVQEAREQYAARAEAETEEAELQEELKKLASKGLDVLAQKVAAALADRARLEGALDDAGKADREREEVLRKLADNRVDEAAIEGLRQKEQSAAVLRAARDAMGTRVEIRALAGVRLRSGDDAPAVLAAGESSPLTLTHATTVTLEGVAEIRFEPRGEDLAKSTAKLTRAERELEAALRALGSAGMAEAKDAARAWTSLDAARKRAEERLAELAPAGLDELRGQVDRSRKRAQTLDEQLTAARRAAHRREQIVADLAAHRVTKEALARLRKLERELADADAGIDQRLARVRAISGPAAAGPVTAWAVSEAVRLETGGVTWEIIPGELGEEHDVEGLEQRLAAALREANVGDLETARERWKAGLRLGAQITELEKQLAGAAPEGLDALRARAAALVGGPASAADDETSEVAPLQAVVEASAERMRAAEAEAERAIDAAEAAERQRSGQDGTVREARAERRAKAERHRAVAERLEASREVEPDANLAQRRASAVSAHHEAQTSAESAVAALDAATPELLRGEVLRAEGAISSLKRSLQGVRDETLRLKTLLDKAALEGNFEEREDARAEQTAATDALARIEQEARAAQLLAEIVEAAYTDAQRVFLAPVLKEAAPYLSKLRPGTEIRMTRDLKLDKVLRRGTEEDFGQLSGGTREQLSVIVRLALARVMARDQRPLPLILDDTMGWTDDSRFLSMVQILRDASRELQIILLTCHPSRFDRFQAEYVVDLDQIKRARGPDGDAGRPRVE
jgi:DNA repair exonuclease SbcCD ATPase subunit